MRHSVWFLCFFRIVVLLVDIMWLGILILCIRSSDVRPVPLQTIPDIGSGRHQRVPNDKPNGAKHTIGRRRPPPAAGPVNPGGWVLQTNHKWPGHWLPPLPRSGTGGGQAGQPDSTRGGISVHSPTALLPLVNSAQTPIVAQGCVVLGFEVSCLWNPWSLILVMWECTKIVQFLTWDSNFLCRCSMDQTLMMIRPPTLLHSKSRLCIGGLTGII